MNITQNAFADLSAYHWSAGLKHLYDKALQQYREGHRNPVAYFEPPELSFLSSIGCTPMELYDFVEDADELAWETALLIATVVRDYFLSVQQGQRSVKVFSMEDFPAKNAELDGIPWLPRLIVKARARLRGELPEQFMFCCGGDRRFFAEHRLHPADFLRLIWQESEDREKILQFVKKSKSGGASHTSADRQGK